MLMTPKNRQKQTRNSKKKTIFIKWWIVKSQSYAIILVHTEDAVLPRGVVHSRISTLSSWRIAAYKYIKENISRWSNEIYINMICWLNPHSEQSIINNSSRSLSLRHERDDETGYMKWCRRPCSLTPSLRHPVERNKLRFVDWLFDEIQLDS